MSILTIPLMQHEKIRANANELAVIIKSGQLSAQSSIAEKLVQRLLITITSHLKVEDEKVYPRLFNHEDAGIRAVSTDFKNEMSALAPQVVAWGEKWNKSSISTRSEEFISETRTVFLALQDRIQREERELYPLLEDA